MARKRATETGSGLVYVVHNNGILIPKAKYRTYKIGSTASSVSDRYYGLGLKMPGEFVCDFAYKFDSEYKKVEDMLHTILNQSNPKESGEWFDLNKETLTGIKLVCERCGGKLDTDTVKKILKEEGSIPSKYTREQWEAMSRKQRTIEKAIATKKLKKEEAKIRKSIAAKKAAATRKLKKNGEPPKVLSEITPEYTSRQLAAKKAWATIKSKQNQ